MSRRYTRLQKTILTAAAIAAAGLAAGCSSVPTSPSALLSPGSTASVASTPGGTPSSSLPATPRRPAAPHASSRPAQARAVSPTGCDASLWQHIYHSYRLHVISQCKTVTGAIEDVYYEPDGDVHMRVAVSASLVNQANDEYEDGDLVAEIICVGTVTQADAGAACQGYRNAVPIPAVGDTVSITGSYVLDADHGWMEIHPVSSVTVTGHSAVAAPATSPAPAPSPSHASGAWCAATVSPANDGYSGDYDVYVTSDEPDQEAYASDAGDSYHAYTSSSGATTITLWHTSPGETIRVTVGAASCSVVA